MARFNGGNQPDLFWIAWFVRSGQRNVNLSLGGCPGGRRRGRSNFWRGGRLRRGRLGRGLFFAACENLHACPYERDQGSQDQQTSTPIDLGWQPALAHPSHDRELIHTCNNRAAMNFAHDHSPADLHAAVTEWYSDAARDLPWRANNSGWSVMVSEFMLQQTPVSRVLPVYTAWMDRWPTPADLAAEPVGEAIRAWGRLGYPRRALRLHAAAVAITEQHGGQVPRTYDELIALPGVGDYTASAIVSFAFGGRAVVLDTNVRRVFARAVDGVQYPHTSVTAAERRLAAELLPAEDAHVWAAATMELGALVCTAKSPVCVECPVAQMCAWRAAGYPEHDGPARKGQAWEGTDRQCRGRLMAVLRASDGPVPQAELDAAWPDEAQRTRCLDTLVADGLVDPIQEGLYALP